MIEENRIIRSKVIDKLQKINVLMEDDVKVLNEREKEDKVHIKDLEGAYASSLNITIRTITPYMIGMGFVG